MGGGQKLHAYYFEGDFCGGGGTLVARATIPDQILPFFTSHATAINYVLLVMLFPVDFSPPPQKMFKYFFEFSVLWKSFPPIDIATFIPYPSSFVCLPSPEGRFQV